MFCSYPITPASPLLHSSRATASSASACSRPRTRSRPFARRSVRRTAARSASRRARARASRSRPRRSGSRSTPSCRVVIVNSQRGGPSTGLPTKTEQSDLYQAVYGRNADAPMPGDRRAHARATASRSRSRPCESRSAHDARDAADRRLSRERRGAVAHTGRGQDPADRDEPASRAQAGQESAP